jgi:hypothetical protein
VKSCDENGSENSRTEMPFLPAFPGNPNSLGCGTSESDGSNVGGESQGLIVVASRDTHVRSRTHASTLQELQQVPIALVDAADDVILSGFSVSEKHQPSTAAAPRTLEFAQIAVWAGSAAAQFGQQTGFEVG